MDESETSRKSPKETVRITALPPRDLVAACAEGDAKAWKRFLEEYGPWMFQVAKRSLSGNEATAEDVVADLYRQFLERDRAILKSFGEPYNLKAWLSVLVRRAAARHRRQMSGGFELEIHFLKTCKKPAVEKFLARLPETDAQILKMYYLEDRSYEEISERTGVPVNTIGKRKFRALTELRKISHFSSAF